MSRKYDEDELAQMAGLGPRAKCRRPAEVGAVEGDEVEKAEGIEGVPETEGDAIEAVQTSRMADRASERSPSQVTIPFREALVITGVSRNTLYSLLSRKAIPGVRKLGGTWRFHHQTLLDWLACK